MGIHFPNWSLIHFTPRYFHKYQQSLTHSHSPRLTRIHSCKIHSHTHSLSHTHTHTSGNWFLEKTMSKHVLPHAPSPTTTSFRRIVSLDIYTPAEREREKERGRRREGERERKRRRKTERGREGEGVKKQQSWY